MIKDYIVLGAGLSGLNTAQKIKRLELGSLLVLDKSRGIGGRMATRRTLNTKFDHGAQFYKLKEDITKLHNLWSEKEISHQWFTEDKIEHWCSTFGMTALPKAMTENLEIQLEKQITSIHFENSHWKLISDKNEEWFCRNLVITSPLPQTINLIKDLDKNNFLNEVMMSEIKNVTYTKALVGLITLEEDIIFHPTGYKEFQLGNIFSISDQKSKKVSDISALTVTMSSDFSELEFDNPEELVVKKILDSLEGFLPNIKIKNIELKKWRYCRPNRNCKKLFFEISPKLFLIGDAFGGSSLSGAVRSSEALCKFLVENKEKSI